MYSSLYKPGSLVESTNDWHQISKRMPLVDDVDSRQSSRVMTTMSRNASPLLAISNVGEEPPVNCRFESTKVQSNLPAASDKPFSFCRLVYIRQALDDRSENTLCHTFYSHPICLHHKAEADNREVVADIATTVTKTNRLSLR